MNGLIQDLKLSELIPLFNVVLEASEFSFRNFLLGWQNDHINNTFMGKN
jgi:hypothetical protein